MTCPSCGRPVAVARASCLYCGAALPQEAVARAEAQTREVLTEMRPALDELAYLLNDNAEVITAPPQPEV